MASNIPVIVQGNSFSLAIPLQIYYINGDQMDLQDYTPDPTDEVSVQLKGSRRNYTYTPTIDGNVANIDLSGNELADNYSVVVSIVKANGQRLRSFRTDQFFIVESSDDLTTDDIIQGLEENVIYLNSSVFVAGEDGRGIESIVKTGTSGLVDTYTITYTDATTSTFTVTNGAQGADGAGITSIDKTSTSGLVDTYTITMSNGTTTTFEVTNGQDGHDLGLASIINNLNSDSTEDALSAAMGKELGDEVFGEQGKVSPNTPIANITGFSSTTGYHANNFVTNDFVTGININLRTGCTLEVVVYDVVSKAVVTTIKTETISGGGIYNITFDEPVRLEANQFIAVKPSTSAVRVNKTDGVGYYYDGTYTAGREWSFELTTLSKGLKVKVAEIENATTIIPTLKTDVIGNGSKYVSPNHDIASMSTGFQSSGYNANVLYTNKKILGVRAFCLKTGTLDVGIYKQDANSVTDIKQISAVFGYNTIIFDTPIYLAPNELVAIKSSAYMVLGYNNSGGVGTWQTHNGNLNSTFEISYELIVEDNGLMGDVAELEIIPTHKSWCSIGTSITYANDHAMAGIRKMKGYQTRVMEKISFSQFTNVGVSGQAMGNGTIGHDVASLAGNVDNVITAIADFYTIEHGVNDWGQCVNVGTIDDFINNTGASTFFGAYRIVIDKIYTLNPNAQIILITPRKAYGYGGYYPNNWWEAKNSTYYLKDYANAVKVIGEFMSLPVCDWFGESNTNQYNLASNSGDPNPAVHPNDVGYQKLANLLVQTFKKVID